MATELQFDIDLTPDDTALRQSLGDALQSAERLEAAVSDSLDAAADDARSIAEAFQDASRSDLSDVADLDAAADDARGIAEGLEGAVESADRIGASLGDAADAASGIGADNAGLEDAASLVDQISAGLGEAADQSDGLGADNDGLQLTVDLVGQINEALAGAAQAAELLSNVDPASATAIAGALEAAGIQGQSLVDVVADLAPILETLPVEQIEAFAAGLGDAVSQFQDGVGGAEAATASLSEKLQELLGVQGETGEGTKENNRLLIDSAILADQVGEAFRDMQAAGTQAMGSVGGALDTVIEKMGGLASLATPENLVGGGFLALELALISVGQQFDALSNQITQATGLTGSGLEEANEQFGDVLRNSDEAASELAGTFGALRRDLDITGESLVNLTVQTGDFLSATGGSAQDVRALTQLVNQFGLTAEQTAEFQDQLVAVQNKYGGSISTLLSTIRTAGPILQTLGFNQGQIAALAGQLDQAGIGVSRLAPRLAKFATDATSSGKDAGEAFRDLVKEIRNADVAAGNAKAFEVFGGRVGPQFANAVRQGVVNLEELDQVLNNSAGAAKAKADELDDLGSVISQLGNNVKAALGAIGKDLSDSLATALARVEPTFEAILDLLAAASPAFGTLSTILGLLAVPIGAISPIVETLADVLDRIPEPVLAMAGAFAVLHTSPFQAIGQGLFNIGRATANMATSLPGAIRGMSGLGSVTGAASTGVSRLAAAATTANIATAALAVGITVATVVMNRNANEQAELERRTKALGDAIGDVGITAEDAAPKLDELLAKGDEGALISDKELEGLAKAGLSISRYRELLQQAASDPNQDIGKELRRSILESVGGIDNLIDKFGKIPKKPTSLFGTTEDAKTVVDTAEGAERLTKEFIEQGEILDSLDPRLKKILDGFSGLTKAGQLETKSKIDRLVTDEKVTEQQRQQAVQLAGLTKESENYVAVYDILIRQVNDERLAREGLSTANDEEAARRGVLLDALKEEGLLREQILDGAARQSRAETLLADASRSGLASNADRVKIIEQLTDAETDQAEAKKLLADADKSLQAIQAKYPENTDKLNSALTTTFRLMGQGVGTADALTSAVAASGAKASEVDSAYSGLQSSLAKLEPPAEASAEAMAALITATSQGLNPAQTMSAVLEATGGNAGDAALAVDQYAQGLTDTSKAIDGLVPKLDTVLGKLQTIPDDAFFGVDAEDQNQAIIDKGNRRKDALDAEKADLEAAKEARQQAADDEVAIQKDALEEQKRVGEAAAKARGEAFDSSAIDLQLRHLKAKTDTSDLDAELASIEQRQKAIDEDVARATAALKVFDKEEQALRSSATVRAQDLDAQIAQLQTAKQLAVDQAAARGQLFDTSGLDAQIAALQAKRGQVSAGLDQDIANARTKSGEVQQAVTEAQGGLLGFGTVLDTFQAQLGTKLAAAQTVTSLRAQGFNDTLALLLGDELGIPDEQRAAFLNQIAQMSPEERTALERHSEEVQAQLAATNAEVKKAGNIFAEPNQEYVDAATARGKDMAKGLTDGVVQGLSDERINEIVDIAIRSGADPTAVREFFRERGAGAGRGFTTGVVDQLKSDPLPIEPADPFTEALNAQLGVKGTEAGTGYTGSFDLALQENPLPIETAAPLTANVNAGMSGQGSAGGANYNAAAGASAGAPLPASTADGMVASVNGEEGNYETGLWAGGWAGGQLYGKGASTGIQDYVTSGAAFNDAFVLGEQIVSGGNAGLGNQSPSVKGAESGRLWVEGVALGIQEATPTATDAAEKMAVQVAAIRIPQPAQPALVGAGSLVGAATGGSFAGSASVEGAAGTKVTIENINVTGTTNASADEVAAAVSRKIGWLGITGRREL